MSELVKAWKAFRNNEPMGDHTQFSPEEMPQYANSLGDAMADEIARLEKEQGDILFLIQTRLQPPGSPCPGGPVMLVTWIVDEVVKKIERLEEENAELKAKLAKYEEG